MIKFISILKMPITKAFALWTVWLSIPARHRRTCSELASSWDEMYDANSRFMEWLDGKMFKTALMWIIVHIQRTYEQPELRIELFLNTLRNTVAETNLTLPVLVTRIFQSFSTANEDIIDPARLEWALNQTSASDGSVRSFVYLIRALAILALRPMANVDAAAYKWTVDLIDQDQVSHLSRRDESPSAQRVSNVLAGN